MTTSWSRGISRSMFLRLWTRAPLMTIWPAIRRLYWLSRLFEFLFDHGAIFFELIGGLRFESKHQRRLGIGRANQPPALGELHAHAVDIDDIVMLAKIFRRFLGDDEFLSSGQSTRSSGVDTLFGRSASSADSGLPELARISNSRSEA